MKQDNYGGNNCQTQTGQDNSNYFGGQQYYYYPQPQPQPSLEERILVEYYRKAGELICESYIRNYESFIDNRCNENLSRLQSSLRLLPGRTKESKEINEEVLKLCESYGEPFKMHMEELKLRLREYGASSNQVREWLADCPKFLRDQKFVGTACSLVGYQLCAENSTETASDFINELIKSYPDSPLAYLTQGLIYYKKGDLPRSLDTVRSARYFYGKQENRDEELRRHFEELEEVLVPLIRQDRFWSRLRQNFAYIVAVTTRFFLLG